MRSSPVDSVSESGWYGIDSSAGKAGSGCCIGRKFSGVGGAVELSNPFVAKLLQSKCEYIVGSMFCVVGAL
jgi:hypothetical protein